MRETCYHCLHADFKAEAKTAEDKASYYFGGYKCDKGEFNPATADTMEKRREKFEEWRNKRK